MRWRSIAVVLLSLTTLVAAKPHKSNKASHGKRSKVHKTTESREKLREESMAVWPQQPELDSRIARIGVPEFDRLLVDRPPLGAPIEDTATEQENSFKRPLAVEKRDRGLAAVAMSHSADPLVRLKLVAEPLLGSPYRSGGESTAGFDCSGFVLTMIRAFGQNLNGRSTGEFVKQGVIIDKDHLQTGDLLFFADHQRSIGHVGIYLADGKFIHSSVSRGVMVSGLEEKYYRAKYKTARRHDTFAAALAAPSDNTP